jgi:hypothetical protein
LRYLLTKAASHKKNLSRRHENNGSTKQQIIEKQPVFRANIRQYRLFVQFGALSGLLSVVRGIFRSTANGFTIDD